MNERAERRAIIALVTVFALLVQMLVPTLAMARERYAGEQMLICTDTGLQAIPKADDHAPAPVHAGKCDHCICAASAASAPAPTADHVPVRYTAYVLRLAGGHDKPAAGRVLAAPPPPSRGPPSLT